MSDQLEAIILDNALAQYSVVANEGDGKKLGPLGRINVFVGANNSGKSRLMRLLASQEKLTLIPKRAHGEITFEVFATKLRQLGHSLVTVFKQQDPGNQYGFQDQAVPFTKFQTLQEEPTTAAVTLAGLQKLAIAPSQNNHGSPVSYSAAVGAYPLALQFMDEAGSPQQISAMLANPPKYGRLYIPTLRSLRDLGSSDSFEAQTRAAYFKDAKQQVTIFTGLSLYTRVTALLLGDHDARERIRDFEFFIGNSFFEGVPVTLVPKPATKESPGELTIKIGNEREQYVRNLGDGIQSLLILTFPLFEYGDKPLLAFIEEPELFMHPWLQRVFLKTLNERFPQHQYFVTTHSNHFLDLTLDVDNVSVFTLEKELEEGASKQKSATFKITPVSSGDHRTLELLGVRNSSVFLSNCTIWVEGITDRKYLAHWLKLYQTHLQSPEDPSDTHFFKEDLHYSFVEYSGGNIVHWSFLDEKGTKVDRLCSKLFLIADLDNAELGDKKSNRHLKLKAELKENFHLLHAKEIENTLSPTAIKAVLLSYKEDENNLTALEHANYRNEPLGKYLDDNAFRDKTKKRRKSYAEGNTILDKPRFCTAAIEAMRKWEDLSDESKDLTEKIFRFIERHNPRSLHRVQVAAS